MPIIEAFAALLLVLGSGLVIRALLEADPAPHAESAQSPTRAGEVEPPYRRAA